MLHPWRRNNKGYNAIFRARPPKRNRYTFVLLLILTGALGLILLVLYLLTILPQLEKMTN
jgi:hypothetical protein